MKIKTRYEKERTRSSSINPVTAQTVIRVPSVSFRLDILTHVLPIRHR